MMKNRTGLEDHYIVKDGKKLRFGYTTGSCAAAAAKAATQMLLTGESVEEIALQTPKGILLHLLTEDISRGEHWVSCAIRKDGGDDPDVTNGILVYAKVTSRTQEWSALDDTVIKCEISIDGGVGVGRVTRTGLYQNVGEAAINPVPRKMIFEAVNEICEKSRFCGSLHVEISIPEGVELAKRTFNPRLGIEGGISVLGTSGIVVPMSEDALIASIRLEMQMHVNNGAQYLVITPGNYGAMFSKDKLDIDLTYSMKCSNYLGETLDMAEELGVKGILFISHIGKFVKVSGGIMNTHSRNGDCRAELMAAQALRAKTPVTVVEQILDSKTTEESVQILKNAGYLDATMEIMAEKIQFYLDHRTGKRIQTGALIFSNVEGILAKTETVDMLMEQINHHI